MIDTTEIARTIVLYLGRDVDSDAFRFIKSKLSLAYIMGEAAGLKRAEELIENQSKQ